MSRGSTISPQLDRDVSMSNRNSATFTENEAQAESAQAFGNAASHGGLQQTVQLFLSHPPTPAQLQQQHRPLAGNLPKYKTAPNLNVGPSQLLPSGSSSGSKEHEDALAAQQSRHEKEFQALTEWYENSLEVKYEGMNGRLRFADQKYTTAINELREELDRLAKAEQTAREQLNHLVAVDKKRIEELHEANQANEVLSEQMRKLQTSVEELESRVKRQSSKQSTLEERLRRMEISIISSKEAREVNIETHESPAPLVYWQRQYRRERSPGQLAMDDLAQERKIVERDARDRERIVREERVARENIDVEVRMRNPRGKSPEAVQPGYERRGMYKLMKRALGSQE